MTPVTTFANGINPFGEPPKEVPGERTRHAVLRSIKTNGAATSSLVAVWTGIPRPTVITCLLRLAKEGKLCMEKPYKKVAYVFRVAGDVA